MNLEVVILAAGQGTRMYSDIPKVLHDLGGKPLLAHVLAAARGLQAQAIHVVYGHGGEQVRERLDDGSVHWVRQQQQLGTAHAVMQALPHVGSDTLVLVLYGDVPLIGADTLMGLVNAAGTDSLALLTAVLADPRGYGRIIRDSAGRVVKIVEEKDANSKELDVKEINTGFLALPASQLKSWVARVDNDNAQDEYYLTDVVAAAVREGFGVSTCNPGMTWEITGVNDKAQLAQLERVYQQKQAHALMLQGVTLRDPARFDVRGEVEAGRDVVIDANVLLEGKVILGDGVRIGPNNAIRDSSIGAGTVILPNCVIEESELGKNCQIGPFARLRPGPRVAEGAKIGNFVEVKKSDIGAGSKINHLSYVGDTTVGKNVNIGAGTITCNYDGANKYRTVIGDDVFIGSNTQLVAPVTVGDGATIGAGSTITKDAPAGELTLSRAVQKTHRGWKRPVKKRKP
ncbi:MAG: bifunctional UDP-N-acetylglucosamine diphosphorylase/glucosamine-1-phosphate N-acetyltransferase GlmU [Gammaproteobacteria bacterium]|nr:MAG: bifunctional UDP-N-acetylglucosamine diphosphorylase/glucosamine-1-phosphate N-acetyltransferase GlmU [Gammaproteobacteria bacterium]